MYEIFLPDAFDRMDGKTVPLTLNGSVIGSVTIRVERQHPGEGLGWVSEYGCTDRHQDCRGTFDPELGCRCV
jgi:hypothetical protein